MFRDKLQYIIFVIFLFIVFIPVTGASSSDAGDYVSSQLIVCFNPEIFSNDQELENFSSQIHAQYNSVVLENSSVLGIPGAQLIQVPDTVSLKDAADWYRGNEFIIFAEPDYIATVSPPAPSPEEENTDLAGNSSADDIRKSKLASLYPNDPYFSYQWNLNKIQVPAAWDITTGSDSVIIAVLDSGVDYNNPDLSGNVWTNPYEIPGNGLDDDLNGYIDDIHGWDFVNNDNVPLDDLGHGTAVASVIGSKGNNQAGLAGILWNVKIMPIKAADSEGLPVSDEVKGIMYAKENGADIIVCSFGKYQYSSIEKMIIDLAPDQLFVCAAGNEGENTDITPFYPSCYANLNIISVAATDSNDNICSFSNYGTDSVDVGAPGSGIPVVSYDSQYYSFDGTSVAAPHVAGLAGLILSIDPTKKPEGLRQLIMDNVDKNQLSGYVGSSGRINAYNTLFEINSINYTITATAGEGGTISPSGSVQVTAGSSRTFTFIPDSGYKVSNVVVDGISQGAVSIFTFQNVQCNHEISVSFEPTGPASYTITATASEGGKISPSGSVQVTAGSSRTFTFIPDSGYKVSNVVVDGISHGALSIFTFQNIRENHDITVIFSTSPDVPLILNISIEPGWNFISTPKSLLDGYDTTGDVFRSIDTAGRGVYFYDAGNSRWKILNDGDIIEELTGIWLYSTQKSTVSLRMNSSPATYNVVLYSGWNALGCPGTSPVSARDAFFSIQEDWSQAIGFNASNQMYETSLINGGSGSHSDVNTLVPAKGYWVYVSESCILH